MPRLPLRTRILGQLFARIPPPAWTLSPEELAKERESLPGEPLRTMILGRKIEMSDVEDLTFQGPAGPLPARMYVPKRDDGALILYFHGGGFVLNSINVYDRQSRRLAHRANARVLSVDYRMAPQDVFPAAFDDGVAALTWFGGMDAERHFVMGDSAGGNLSTGVCLDAVRRGAWVPDGQILLYPVTDMSTWHPSVAANESAPVLPRALLEFYHRTYAPELSQRSDPRASPLLASDLSGSPPALVFTAKFDPLHDEGVAYATALSDAGVSVDHLDIEDTCHGYFTFPSWCTGVEETLERVRVFVGGA